MDFALCSPTSLFHDLYLLYSTTCLILFVATSNEILPLTTGLRNASFTSLTISTVLLNPKDSDTFPINN